MWLDILRLFPQVTVMGPGRFSGNGGRAKRSATFPGIRNLGTNFMSPASRFANNKAANANSSLTKSNKTDEVDYDEENEGQDEDMDQDGEDIEGNQLLNVTDFEPLLLIDVILNESLNYCQTMIYQHIRAIY